MSERYDTRDADWPLRPWIMAAICAVAGLIFDFLTDLDYLARRLRRRTGRRRPSSPSPPCRSC